MLDITAERPRPGRSRSLSGTRSRSDPWYETIWIRPMVIGGSLGEDRNSRVYRVPAIR